MRARLLPLLALATPLLRAQVDRHELGLRLRAFERELARCSEPDRRDRALQELAGAVRAFFGLDLAGAARAIELARLSLHGAEADARQLAAASLMLRLSERLVDGATATANATLLRAYDPVNDDDEDGGDLTAARDDVPTDLTIALSLADHDAATTTTATLAALPLDLALPLQGMPTGDHVLRWSVQLGREPVQVRQQGLSIVRDRDARLRALVRAADERSDDDANAPDLEAATLPHLVRLLQSMTRRNVEETVLPGDRLLAEAEALAALPRGGRYYGADRPGDFWLRVPTTAGTATVRLLVPRGIDPARPVPLVLALHGAGGSENLFFDGYGDGEIVRQCGRRGWLLCAPRTAGLTGVDLPALVDALQSRFPLAPARVLVVGHSMGAMQAMGQASRSPSRFAAIAALAGGGAVRPSAALRALPFLVATGGRDFARPGALQLQEQLRAAGADVTAWDDPIAEHLSVVQLALPTVFAWFDGVLERR